MNIDATDVGVAAGLVAIGTGIGVALSRLVFAGRWMGNIEAQLRAQGAEIAYLRQELSELKKV